METIVDTRGLSCPMPLLTAKQALKKLLVGELLRIWVDDGASIEDLRLLLNTLNMALLDEADTDKGHYFLVQKKEAVC